MEHEIPERIREYFERAVADPPPEPRGTLLEQRGEMRLAPEKPWMPFTGEQSMEADRVGFVWHARVRMAPLVTCVVDDAYEDGHGRLDAKVLGVVPVARARGVDVDRGEAQRYLAELAWCPMALVHNPQLRYRQISDDVVRVWAGDMETYVDLSFDAEGEVTAAKTETRVRGDTGETQTWEGRFSDYRDFGDLRAPSHGEVGWRTPDGLYLYWRGEVTSIRWSR